MGNMLNYEPTPKEIAKATAKIRENWSEREYRKRAVGVPLVAEWTPPLAYLEDQRLLDAVVEHNLGYDNVTL